MVILTKTKISTDVKTVWLQNWLNVLPAVVEAHLVLLVAQQIMKMVLRTVHAWRAVLRGAPALNGTVATFLFTCYD